MKLWLQFSTVAIGAVCIAAGFAACSAGNTASGSAGGASGVGGNSSLGNGGNGTGNSKPTSTTTTGNAGGFTGAGGNNGSGGAPSCAKFTDEAKALPAAMMIVLDMSASMGTKVNGIAKYVSARNAIIQAIDDNAFDNTAIGLTIFPDHKVGRPDCCAGCPAMVSCGFPMTPSIPLADSGTLKSTDTSGVRHNMATYLQTSQPLNSLDDGSPDYEALQGSYTALQAYAGVDKRFSILVSDGGFSCTSLSNPTRPGYSDTECPDWEEPPTVNTLIGGAYNDPMAPVNTFIVGVPGSNTHGGMSGLYANAPYSMLLALSTYAVSGSPNTVDPTCDSTAVFTQGGSPPNFPCHIDLSNGAQFTSNALAQAISKVRGQALGCTYDLPDPPPGQTIDPSLVNVIATLNGTTSTFPKRSNPADMCVSYDCWDYNSMNQVQLIGKGCSDVETASTAKIEIEVGCMTLVK